MSSWTLWIGLAFTIAGLVLLSPLGDLLPVNVWQSLRGLFESSAEPVTYRVVPVELSRVVEFALIGIGLALVGASLYVKYRNRI